jgi:hypothetical protein
MSVSLIKDADIHNFIEADTTLVAERVLRPLQIMNKILQELRTNGPAPIPGSWEFYIEQARLSVLGLAPDHAFSDPTLCDGPAMALGLTGTVPETSEGWRDLFIDIFSMSKACEVMNAEGSEHIAKLIFNLDIILSELFDLAVERDLMSTVDLALLAGAIAHITSFAVETNTE